MSGVGVSIGLEAPEPGRITGDKGHPCLVLREIGYQKEMNLIYRKSAVGVEYRTESQTRKPNWNPHIQSTRKRYSQDRESNALAISKERRNSSWPRRRSRCCRWIIFQILSPTCRCETNPVWSRCIKEAIWVFNQNARIFVSSLKILSFFPFPE